MWRSLVRRAAARSRGESVERRELSSSRRKEMEAIRAVPSVAPRAIGGLLEQNQGSRHRPRVLVVLFVAILVSFFVVSKLIKLALILKPLHFLFC